MPIYGFDFDGTLVKTFTAEPLPNVRERLHALPAGALTFVATNQAGPVFRTMYGTSTYPTVANVVTTIVTALNMQGLDFRPDLLVLCCNSGQLSADWSHVEAQIAGTFRRQLAILPGQIAYEVSSELAFRKPQPGMLVSAAEYFQVPPADMIYVGDMETDEIAARRAGVRFVDAEDWRAGTVEL